MKGTVGEWTGGTQSPELAAYGSAGDRCRNQSHPRYAGTGGRGVKFLYKCFKYFIDDVGRRPAGHHDCGRSKYSLRRLDPAGHFAPKNCRWMTSVELHSLRTRQRAQAKLDGVRFREYPSKNRVSVRSPSSNAWRSEVKRKMGRRRKVSK